MKRLIVSALQNALVKFQVVQGDGNNNARRGALHRAWGHVFTNHLRGDYIEFGVYHGSSLIESWRQYAGFDKWLSGQLKHAEPWRRTLAENYADYAPRFIGVDTFDGMPDNNEGNAIFAKGTFKSELGNVKQACAKAGIPADRLNLVQGKFSDIPSLPSQGAAIINIDCDLYQSTVDALNLCRGKIQQGTVILADDYHCFAARDDMGERRALNEFSEATGIRFERWFSYQYSGMAFFCHLP